MAHSTQVIGRHSELIAQQALLASGYEVSEPILDESYDIVARDPITKKFIRVQVKTVRVREDRGGQLVVYARKGKEGRPYTKADCDVFIGILGDRAFMFECRGIQEYWSSEANVSERWIELPTQLKKHEGSLRK